MNNNKGGNNLPGKQSTSHNNRAENKDNLDSRSNEEFDTKGDDITHNQKETKSDRKNVKNDGKH